MEKFKHMIMALNKFVYKYTLNPIGNMLANWVDNEHIQQMFLLFYVLYLSTRHKKHPKD